MRNDVRELISLSALDDTVEDEDVAVSLGGKDEDILYVSITSER